MVFALVVSPVRLFREGLARALEADTGSHVLGTAGGVPDARRAIAELGPDVVLVDTSAPGGVDAACELADPAAGTRVVAVGCSESERDVLACAEAGVAAFVAREGTAEDVAAAIQAVVRGETACTPQVAALLLRRVADGARARRSTAASAAPLTARERQVVALIDDGLTNKEIAARLSIELSTVKNHVHHVIEKLGARGRSDAAAQVRTVSGARGT